MRFLVIVSSSPWGSSLASAALRFVRAALADGDQVVAVFFNGDGIYNALPGESSDGGGPGPQTAWSGLGKEYGLDLILCPAARARRLGSAVRDRFSPSFREGGLASLLELMERCDRVISF